jgi:cytochrome c oxidase assembly protein subunit 15
MLATSTSSRAASSRAVSIWLLAIVAMIGGMVVLGGITRLTGSGLSMVEWHPLMGALPPLSEADWTEVFEQYQNSPQYQLVNDWMVLADFKQIFLWEYLHRLCGRLLGLVFFLPFLFFLKTKRLQGRLTRRVFVAFVLGGLQGILGWYMVKSGLSDRPSVSHFRLAAHLSLAFVTALYVFWIWLDLRIVFPEKRDSKVLRALAGIGVLVGIQIVYGAFMAGLRAGLVFPGFPLIEGSLLPFSKLEGLSLAEAALWNPAGIHLIHRALGWLLLLAAPAVALWARSRATSPLQKRLCTALGLAVLVQFTLGAFTILKLIAIPIAVAHQLGALALAGLILATGIAFGWGKPEWGEAKR